MSNIENIGTFLLKASKYLGLSNVDWCHDRLTFNIQDSQVICYFTKYPYECNTEVTSGIFNPSYVHNVALDINEFGDLSHLTIEHVKTYIRRKI